VALRGRRRRHVEVVRHRGELDGGDALGARQLLEVDGDAGRQGRGAGATIESIEQPRGALVERTAPTEGLLDARPGCEQLAHGASRGGCQLCVDVRLQPSADRDPDGVRVDTQTLVTVSTMEVCT